MLVASLNGSREKDWLVIFSAAWLGAKKSYEFPELTAAPGFTADWAPQPGDLLRVESMAVRSNRDFARTIAADRQTHDGSQLEYAKKVDTLSAP